MGVKSVRLESTARYLKGNVYPHTFGEGNTDFYIRTKKLTGY